MICCRPARHDKQSSRGFPLDLFLSFAALPATIRLIYTQGSTLKQHFVRSAFVQATCKVHEKYEGQQKKGKRSRGKPRDDCLSCRAGLQQIMCDQKNIVCSLECRLCDAEYVGATRRTARAKMSEHHATTKSAELPEATT